MKKARVYFFEGERKRVSSLAGHLLKPLATNFTMRPKYMRQSDRNACRWIGFGIGKGVTSPKRDISIYAVLHKMHRGLHAELVKGFPGLDPFPLCYKLDHVKGFGDFVRWVYFADPMGRNNVLGIDWSIAERPTSGVATSMSRAASIVKTLISHGLPKRTEIALLNWRMCEEPAMYALRMRLGLRTAADWISKAEKLFGPKGAHCLRCGLCTRKEPGRFCFRCGCKFELFLMRGEK